MSKRKRHAIDTMAGLSYLSMTKGDAKRVAEAEALLKSAGDVNRSPVAAYYDLEKAARIVHAVRDAMFWRMF